MKANYRTKDGDEAIIKAPTITAYPHEKGFAVIALNQSGTPVAGIFDVMEFDIDENAN